MSVKNAQIWKKKSMEWRKLSLKTINETIYQRIEMRELWSDQKY